MRIEPFVWLIFVGCWLAAYGLTCAVLLRLTSKRFAIGLFAVSAVIRLVAVWVLFIALRHLNHGNPFLLGQMDGDDQLYHYWSAQMARAWHSGETLHLPFVLSAYSGYIWWNALLYYLFAPHTLVARAANALIGAATAVLVYRATQALSTERVARHAGLLVALFPYLVFFSALQYKDTIVAFAIMAAVWAMLTVKNRPALVSVGVILASVVVLSNMRWQMAVSMTMVAVIHWLIEKRTHRGRAVLMAAITVVVVGGVLRHFLPVVVPYKLIDFARMQEFQDKLFAASTLNAGAFALLTRHNLLPLALVLPVVLPLPTIVYGQYPLLNVFFSPMALIWHLVLPFSIVGFITCVRYRARETFPLWAVVIGSLLGLLAMFQISAIRRMVMLFPLLLILAAIGYRRMPHRRLVYPVYLLVLVLGIALYNVIRGQVF